MKKVLYIILKGCYINFFYIIVCNINIICGSDVEYFFLIFWFILLRRDVIKMLFFFSGGVL